MDNEDAKFRSYLLGELYWELEQHPHMSSPFTGVEREAVEVLTFVGYDDLRVRVAGVVYDIHLSWKKAAPPVITRVDTNAPEPSAAATDVYGSLGGFTRMNEATESEIEELHKLERTADELLSEISRSGQPASEEVLHKLEDIAGAAARIAFLRDGPRLLTQQMSALITWTDHLDEGDWVSRFRKALRSRPLVPPWK